MNPSFKIQGALVLKLFLTAMASLRLVALDLDPKVVGIWPEFGRGRVIDMALTRDYAFLSKGSAGLDVVDIRNPWRPVRVGGSDEVVGRITAIGNRLYSSG